MSSQQRSIHVMHRDQSARHGCGAAWLWGAVARPLQRGQQHDNKDKKKRALKRNKQANKHQKSGLRRRDRGGVKSFFFEARGFYDFMLPGNSTKTQPVLKATSPCVSRAPRILSSISSPRRHAPGRRVGVTTVPGVVSARMRPTAQRPAAC
jgi:hypothetical protein